MRVTRRHNAGNPHIQGTDTPLSFKWDDAKATSNAAKHRVTFDYAAAVFLDAARAGFDASRAEDGESRRKVVGLIEGGSLPSSTICAVE